VVAQKALCNGWSAHLYARCNSLDRFTISAVRGQSCDVRKSNLELQKDSWDLRFCVLSSRQPVDRTLSRSPGTGRDTRPKAEHIVKNSPALIYMFLVWLHEVDAGCAGQMQRVVHISGLELVK
jgi:hypothetical protein